MKIYQVVDLMELSTWGNDGTVKEFSTYDKAHNYVINNYDKNTRNRYIRIEVKEIV